MNFGCRIYKKLRYYTKRWVILLTRNKIAVLLELLWKMPQNYSFFVFGTHGVGLNSLLHYISLCKDLSGGGVYPLPLFVFTRNIDLFGSFYNMRFRKKILPILQIKAIKKWGLTFEGEKRTKQWVDRNITLKCPAIVLVRDPILAILSVINYEIFYCIHSGLSIDMEAIYYKVMQHLQGIVGYRSNLEYMEEKCKSIVYFDCTDFMGKKTLESMKIVGEHLDIKVEYFDEFEKSINSPIQRQLASPLKINGKEYYVSTFPRICRLTVYPDYLYPNYCDNLGFEIVGTYKSDLFANEIFYIFSKTQEELTESFFGYLRVFLSEVRYRLDEYEKVKVSPRDFLDFLSLKDEVQMLKDRLSYEVSSVPKEIVQKWNIFNSFLRDEKNEQI